MRWSQTLVAATAAALSWFIPAPLAGAQEPPLDSPACLVGIITVTHGQMGAEAVNTAQMVVGEQDALLSISIDPNDDPEERRQALLAAIEEADAGCGVLLLTDFFGGTPTNIAISTMAQGRIEVVSGLNLPMLIKSISMRASNDVVTISQSAATAGRRYINRAADLLRRQDENSLPSN